MVKLIKPLLITSVFMLVISCGGPNYLLVRSSSVSEAALLKEHCARINLDSKEIRSADSLLNLAQHHSLRGKDEEAYLFAEMASARYLLALARVDLPRSQTELHEMEVGTKDIGNKVNMYEQILEDIRAARGP